MTGFYETFQNIRTIIGSFIKELTRETLCNLLRCYPYVIYDGEMEGTEGTMNVE